MNLFPLTLFVVLWLTIGFVACLMAYRKGQQIYRSRFTWTDALMFVIITICGPIGMIGTAIALMTYNAR